MSTRSRIFGAIVALNLATPITASTKTTQQGNDWQIENERIRVLASADTGAIRVLDKISGYEWKQPNAERGGSQIEPKFRNVRALAAPESGIAFEADFGKTNGRPNSGTVTLAVPAGKPDTLVVTFDMPDRNVEAHTMPFLDPFILDTPHGVMAVADYCNGHVYPVDGYPGIQAYHAADRLDMPWVGLCDLARGFGWLMIIDTSDNAHVHFKQHAVGDKKLVAPHVIWVSSKRRFEYPRRLVYRFLPKGGYVALAKAFRAYAKDKGLLVTLAEKAKKSPNVKRLFGAIDVWGDASLAFARQAKAAGIDKMLINGRASPDDMRAISELGYLTSEYDNYTDILPLEPGKEIDRQHAPLPGSAVLKSDGKRMTAWLTLDKKRQYMKRCPALWVETAKVVVPKALNSHPFLGRFVDVTTAEGLYECFDPKHPLTKAQKRQCGVDLLSYVRSLGLVVGGEHGIWWAVPHLDYIEGMMSGSPWCYSWPAGHLVRPTTRDQRFTSPWGRELPPFETYEKWGIGHQWRAPLWELVFHDCVISTWYWGDTNGWLLRTAPEITPKKDAFNILYGTMPMIWANKPGAWQTNRQVALRTYRNVCKLHEAIAGTEMLSHEFVTPDHHVQRTRFSDGTEVIVNFGPKPYRMKVGENDHLLPQNGFSVKGPRVEQSLLLVNGKPVTTIRRPDYRFSDATGGGFSMRRLGRERIRVRIGKTDGPDIFRPADVAPNWDLTTTRAYKLDAHGRRDRHVEWQRWNRDRIWLSPEAWDATVDVLCGSKAAGPDLTFRTSGTSMAGGNEGCLIHAGARLQNVGGTTANDVVVAFYVDAVQRDRLLASQSVSISSGKIKTVCVESRAFKADGTHRIIAVADPEDRIPELCEENNSIAEPFSVAPDFARWPHRRALSVQTGELERREEPVTIPIELPRADLASVRVVRHDKPLRTRSFVPSRLDVMPDGSKELCFTMTRRTPPKTTRRFLVLWDDAVKQQEGNQPKHGRWLPPPSTMWNPASKTVEGQSYRLAFADGIPVEVAAKRGNRSVFPFLSALVHSSAETGWTEELNGKVNRFDVVLTGPVRTRIVVRKALQAGFVYTKTYTFYPRYFDVEIDVNRPGSGLYSRGFYARKGTCINDQGQRAIVDGEGEAEAIHGGKDPKWFAVFAKDWAHSCIALSPFDHTCYWDSTHMGGIGFVSKKSRGNRIRYVIHHGATDAEFAKRDYARAITPVKVTLGETSTRQNVDTPK